MRLTPEIRAKLAAVSTATLCTALFKRGLRNQFPPTEEQSKLDFAAWRKSQGR